MSTPLYCISGLGADERIFSKLDIPGSKLIHIKWLKPDENESLQHYALRMSRQVQHSSPVVMGVSFGGILAIEMSRHIAMDKIILVASIKTREEMPTWMKMAGQSKLNKIMPLKTNRFIEPVENYFLGIESEEETELVRDYRLKADPDYVNWAIDKVLNWQNSQFPPNLVHIHGDKDRIFSYSNVKADITIKNAGHLMLVNRADELSRSIYEILNKHSRSFSDN